MIDHVRKVVFIHIPKNAGKSVEIFLQGAAQGNPHWRDLDLVDLMRRGLYKDYWSFAIVRNPLDRLSSVYCYYVFSSGNRSRNDQLIKYYLREMGFPTFVEAIHDGYGTLVDRIPNFRQDLFPHLIDQSRYVLDDYGRVMLSWLGRFEKMSEVSSVLEQKFFAGRRLGKFNASRRPSWQSMFSMKTFRMACEIYKRDIHLFCNESQLQQDYETGRDT